MRILSVNSYSSSLLLSLYYRVPQKLARVLDLSYLLSVEFVFLKRGRPTRLVARVWGLYLVIGSPCLQGWRSGESTRLPPMWPGFDSQIRRQMWVEFVGSLLCTERFSSGTPVSPLPKNQNLNLT